MSLQVMQSISDQARCASYRRVVSEQSEIRSCAPPILHLAQQIPTFCGLDMLRVFHFIRLRSSI